MGRWLAVDFGSRRIGLAVSDRDETMAFPARVLPAAAGLDDAAAQVLAAAAVEEADGVVIGLPLNMDGTDSAQTRCTRDFIAAVRARSTLPVEVWDERLTSFQADQWLDEAAVPPNRRRQLRDALAATALLRSFLAARRPPSSP